MIGLKKLKVIKTSVLCALFFSVSFTANAGGYGHNNNDITIYLTRHAEKKTTTLELGVATQTYYVATGDGASSDSKGKNRDDVCGTAKCAEELNARGLHRADLLAEWFDRWGIVNKLDAVYSSHKVRTFQTVKPTADAAGLSVIQLPANSTELNPEKTTPSECPTLDAINTAAPGSTILIAGHSGTLYDIMGDGNDDCVGLGLLADADPSSNRFPKDGNGKVANFGDIWKIVIRNGVARFKYRINLDTTKLKIVDFAH